jgi:hypothetical protein
MLNMNAASNKHASRIQIKSAPTSQESTLNYQACNHLNKGPNDNSPLDYLAGPNNPTEEQKQQTESSLQIRIADQLMSASDLVRIYANYELTCAQIPNRFWSSVDLQQKGHVCVLEICAPHLGHLATSEGMVEIADSSM